MSERNEALPPRLHPGRLPHHLLSVACAEGQTRAALTDRLARLGIIPDSAAARIDLHNLTRAGYLAVVGTVPCAGRPANLYALTPEGEVELDRLSRRKCPGEHPRAFVQEEGGRWADSPQA